MFPAVDFDIVTVTTSYPGAPAEDVEKFITIPIEKELKGWIKKMKRRPSIINRTTARVQGRINRIVPEKIHQIFTSAIKQMTRAVVFGAGFTTRKPEKGRSLELVEAVVQERIRFYRSTAAAEGAVTGAGGFIWGLADFPLWLTLKMKMMYEIAAQYGFDTKDYKERIFILHIFQLTFSNQQHRNDIFRIIQGWDKQQHNLPDDIHQFDWRTFQIQYRDYIDLVKLLQMIPGFGAAVGLVVNHRLTTKLGKYAMNAYRLRLSQKV